MFGFFCSNFALLNIDNILTIWEVESCFYETLWLLNIDSDKHRNKEPFSACCWCLLTMGLCFFSFVEY